MTTLFNTPAEKTQAEIVREKTLRTRREIKAYKKQGLYCGALRAMYQGKDMSKALREIARSFED